MLNDRKMQVAMLMLIYLASLPFNGFCYGETHCWAGVGILAFGFLGLMMDAQISWLANLLIVPTWLLLLVDSKASNRASAMCGIAALLVGNAFLLQGVNTSEAGGLLEDVTSLGMGYWLWIGSIALSTLVAVHSAFRRRDRAPS